MDNPLTELNPTSLERIHSASENLYELIENVSLLRLQQLLQSEETTIQNLEEKQPLLPGYWMSLILLAGPEFRLIIQYFYNSSDILEMAETILQKDPFKNNANTFMKIYSNQVVNLLAACIQRTEIPINHAIPILVKGFDKIFLPKDKYPLLFEKNWKLAHREKSIYCSVKLEMIQSTLLKQLRQIDRNIALFSKVVDSVTKDSS